MKQLLFNEEARSKIKSGMDTLANAVKVTLGPKGRNVVIDRQFETPIITKDGVTVAREIELEDPFENMGAKLIKEVASKTNDSAGDGTTTATVLAQALITEGLKQVAAGINPIEIRKEIETRTTEIVKGLKELSKPVLTNEEIRQIASISANEKEIGDIIAETIEIVGKEGVITIESGNHFGVEKEIVDGLEFNKGYVSPYMVTNIETMKAEIENCKILVTDKRLASIPEIKPFLEMCVNSGLTQLVIIADEVEGDVLTTLIMNRMKGKFNCLAIKSPGFGDEKNDNLQDISYLTGAKFISDGAGMKLSEVTLDDLGFADKVVSSKDSTIIIGGSGDVKDRVAQLKNQKEEEKIDYKKEMISKRIAKLTGGVAIIKVGGATEAEIKEKKYRVEDALNATKSAIEEGIVPGGGLALLKASYGANFAKFSPSGKKSIVDNAIEAPFKQICLNAGVNGSLILYDIFATGKGYNAATGKYCDLLEAGIIDPTKVVRCALENAASAAALFLTTEVIITEKYESKN